MRSIAAAKSVFALLGALATLAAFTPAAGASPGPAWSLAASAQPSSFVPGRESAFLVAASNVGAVPTTAPVAVEASFPQAVSATKAQANQGALCTFAAHTVRCETTAAIPSGEVFLVEVALLTEAAASGSATIPVTLSGGGLADVSTTAAVTFSAAEPPFGILAPGLRAPLTEVDGAPAALAGSHPYQQTLSFAFPTFDPPGVGVGLGELTGAGHPRDIDVDLPPGLIGDPAVNPVLCTEVQLTTHECPAASAIGLFELTTIVGPVPVIVTSPLYNMVPPAGHPAELATDVDASGIFAHLFPALRSDSDYGIEVATPDILALGTLPVLGIQTQVWGDPSSPFHDAQRGRCAITPQSCPVAPRQTAFWSLPGRCDGQPDTTNLSVDSWEEPGVFKEAAYLSADLEGNPVSLSGCNVLEFAPTLSATPTTDLADSPTGLDVDLHQPQDLNKEHRATAELKDATVTLAKGLVANPSQADGLAACTEGQIGYLGEGHYSRDPQSCPDAAKIGSAEVTSPLLAEYTEAGTKLATDPETGAPIPRPLHGSVFLAKPFENEFGSLLAIYLAIEDPRSGTVSKLAGKVIPDPQTGQLSTVFEENPQLPLEDIRLHLYGGARASLISPPTCGTHTTTSTLTPWSSPEGEDAHPESSFQTTAEPGGGDCPATEGAASNKPAFVAGTISPVAGAYSPFVLKLSREDGSQRLAGIDTTLPPGLSGKLAGIAECSEAQIAQAKSYERPNQGGLEQASPSCPASSEVGTVNVGAGAGPTPFYVSGHAYLAGPYRGAPLSLAIITPAIAGPFDLGTVVVRAALYVDPETAQIHAVSDPLPQILDGIPLDVRSVALKMDRPDFTLNPTSCEPMSILGSATSTLGQSAALTNPFQVGGCSALGFKPKLSIKLSGGTKRSKNPALRAVLTYPTKGAYANIAKAQVALPHAEFLDQGHIDTVCTRPQLAAEQCPAGSIYGRATAWTPLLDKPLEGPVYLGVGFGHSLPDLVADLNGQIRVLLHGKVDTDKEDGIRNTFEVVPDAPVTKFVLELKGGRKGLLVNSENICKKISRATANFTAQNGKVLALRPVISNSCKKQGGKNGGGKHRKSSKQALSQILLGRVADGW